MLIHMITPVLTGIPTRTSMPIFSTSRSYKLTFCSFFRAVRNFVIDLTATSSGTGIHWQVAQASSLINIVFNMGNTNSQGIFMDNGM